MKHFPAFALVWLLAVCAASALDLETLDGRTYRNVTVLGVTPVDLDILYYRDNVAVMRGIKFTELPAAVRKQFGYNPGLAALYTRQMNRMIQRNFQAHLAMRRSMRMNAALENAMMFYRMRATIQVREALNTGAVCLIDFASNSAAERFVGQTIFLFGCTGQLDDEYTCLLYPTGMHINMPTYGSLPVYAMNYQTARGITEFGLAQARGDLVPVPQAATAFVPPTGGMAGMMGPGGMMGSSNLSGSGIYYQNPNLYDNVQYSPDQQFYAPNAPSVNNPPVWGFQ